MGRKQGGPWSGKPLGNTEMETAINSLNRKFHQAITLLTEYKPSREATLAMLFPPDAIDRATKARGYVTPDYENKQYDIHRHLHLFTQIHINYEGAKALPLRSDKIEIDLVKAEPLLNYIKAAEAIYLQYEEVKGVLRWLNGKATPAAIRYYWPSILRIAPSGSIFKQMHETPQRYVEPYGLYDWTQKLRDSAHTVATMALTPDDTVVRPYKNMRLLFMCRAVKHVGDMGDPTKDAAYQTDSMTINL